MPEASAPNAMPLNHRVLNSQHEKDFPSLKMLLLARNAVADILKTQPPGTCAETAATWMFLAPVNGELVLFETENPQFEAGDGTNCLMTPVRTIDALEYESIYFWSKITDWLQDPVYAEPYDPAVISQEVASVMDCVSEPSWVWSGNDPMATPEVVG